jgi:hypothetical protein
MPFIITPSPDSDKELCRDGTECCYALPYLPLIQSYCANWEVCIISWRNTLYVGGRRMVKRKARNVKYITRKAVNMDKQN